MNRITDLMGIRDSLYQMNNMVELDEGSFEIEVSSRELSKLTGGKGSQRQENVAVMAISVPL